MKKSQPKTQKYVHFIGIGGIGVSALAQYYLSEGWEISGSDLVKSDATNLLKEMRVKVVLQNKKLNLKNKKQKLKIKKFISDADLIVYSAAALDGPSCWEVEYAKKLKIKTLSYAEALGELTRKYKTICVSGTHGKSTTTAMLALIIIKAGLDPTVILGTKLKEFYMWDLRSPTYNGSNFRRGKSEWLLIEADEFNASFLNYSPQMIVLTNIEADHLDFYKDLNDIKKTFKKYLGNLADDGTLIVNGDDKNIASILNGKLKISKYSLKNKENASKLKKILKVSGEYNIYNALAALTAARALKISDKISFKALGEFTGAWRRMETIGKYKGVKIISDYAHHPTEVKAILGTISNSIVVFQPHQQRRTEKLFDDFVKVFGKADPKFKIIITDIYGVAGREKKHKNMKTLNHESKNAEDLVDVINRKYPDANVIYVSKRELKRYIKNMFHVPCSMFHEVVFMGAGDIDALARDIVSLNH